MGEHVGNQVFGRFLIVYKPECVLTQHGMVLPEQAGKTGLRVNDKQVLKPFFFRVS